MGLRNLRRASALICKNSVSDSHDLYRAYWMQCQFHPGADRGFDSLHDQQWRTVLMCGKQFFVVVFEGKQFSRLQWVTIRDSSFSFNQHGNLLWSHNLNFGFGRCSFPAVLAAIVLLVYKCDVEDVRLSKDPVYKSAVYGCGLRQSNLRFWQWTFCQFSLLTDFCAQIWFRIRSDCVRFVISA